MTPPVALDLASVVVFALTGALVASRAQLDIVGFIFLACLTAVGGGTIRDLLLGRDPVFWISTPVYVLLAAASAVVVFFTAHLLESRYKVLVWLDALDLPTVYAMEASFCIEGESQTVRNQPDASQNYFTRAGLAPMSALGRPKDVYALKRFPWRDVRSSLEALASVTNKGEAVQLAYVNPETGEPCMPVLGFSAILLRPGETISPVRKSSSAVINVVEGQGQAIVDGVELDWGDSDTFAVPTHAVLQITNTGTRPAYLFQVDEAPMQRKLGFYQEFPAG